MSETSISRLMPAPDITALAERPIDTVERIGRIMYGELWIGKTALDLAVSHQRIRRWLAGNGSPSAEEVAWLQWMARQVAANLLRAAGDETP
ncbi:MULTISPECIES: hypothetical protein [Methylobacterium]|uniref:hypothetical protein n=1 Tax=Methylobacterium TaxID=407 RepID=UPI002F323C1D